MSCLTFRISDAQAKAKQVDPADAERMVKELGLVGIFIFVNSLAISPPCFEAFLNFV